MLIRISTSQVITPAAIEYRGSLHPSVERPAVDSNAITCFLLQELRCHDLWDSEISSRKKGKGDGFFTIRAMKESLILSMKYWLFNRDPYNGLL